MQTFVLMFWSYGVIGVICSCGEMMTSEFQMISIEINQCNWYLLPLEIQQMLQIFMTNAQQFIRGYGNIFCTRETFKNVSSQFTLNMKLKRNYFQSDFLYLSSRRWIKLSHISWLFVDSTYSGHYTKNQFEPNPWYFSKEIFFCKRKNKIKKLYTSWFGSDDMCCYAKYFPSPILWMDWEFRA